MWAMQNCYVVDRVFWVSLQTQKREWELCTKMQQLTVFFKKKVKILSIMKSAIYIIKLMVALADNI